MASDTEITKVRIVIRHLLWQIREVRNDRDAAWKWVNRFANTLQYQDLEQDPDQYALAILAEARSFNDQKKRNQQMRWVREQLEKEGVTSPTQEQLDEKWLEMYGNDTTADGDIREDSQDRKSGTSANIYGDASHREAEDESATVSRTMSRSPEAAAQSGKDYDQETAKTRDTRDDSRGRYAPPSCSPEDGNPAETAPSHGGSVASLEARQGLARESQRRTDGYSLRVGNVARPPVRSRASFRNKEDFIQWAIDDGLDPVDAGECWEATEERGGKDADGNTVKNMKAFARQWCRTRANNRRTA